jgi:hypothetical protein
MAEATIVRSYGSVPGELAACIRHVGLVRRADLGAMPAGGDPLALEETTARLLGHALAVGGSARVAGAWWCRPEARTLLLVGASEALARTVGLLRTHARRRPMPVIDGDVQPLEAIGVVGRLTAPLLRELGVYGPLGDPREAPPCAPLMLGGARTVWLLESDVSAICCVERADAAALETVIAAAGRPLGLARVGQDALAQYLLLERRRA